MKVRKDSITAEIDGKLIARHVTDFSDLNIPGGWRWTLNDDVLGLGTTFDAVTFHKAELVYPFEVLDSNSLVGRAPPQAAAMKGEPARGFALRIDGQADPIDLTGVQLHGPGPWTVEAWITPREPLPSGGRNAIIFMVDPAWFSIRDASVGPKWSAGGPVFKPPPEQVSRRKVQVGKAVHVALVRSQEGVSFFVDGELQSDPLLIGAFSKQPRPRFCPPPSAQYRDKAFFGDIDEMRISIVARTFGGEIPKRRFDVDSDTLALYHFDEGTGDVLSDASGQGHHARIAAGTWIGADGGSVAK